jgi:hypothetical protein
METESCTYRCEDKCQEIKTVFTAELQSVVLRETASCNKKEIFRNASEVVPAEGVLLPDSQEVLRWNEITSYLIVWILENERNFRCIIALGVLA